MFIYSKWDKFCSQLTKVNVKIITAEEAISNNVNTKYIILKHDVETNPKKALKMAKIENKYGLKGSYYIQAYLLKNKKHIKFLSAIKELGHEVSYHHDVMDSNQGDIHKAIIEFEKNRKLFENNNFTIRTVCQHGNPIVKRMGYYSNRDFFRNPKVKEKYPNISEIMVDFKDNLSVKYEYISDAGYGWKVIFDPENNDRIKSEDKDIKLNDLRDIISLIKEGKSLIISTHPHRWETFLTVAYAKDRVFKVIKCLAKLGMKIQITKKIMEKFYFLAKKI